MKRSLLMVICGTFLIACKEEENLESGALSSVLHIEEIQINDTQIPVISTTDFYYSDNRLISAIEKQSFKEGFIADTFTVVTEANSMIVTNGIQEIKYQLDENGYAVSASLIENITNYNSGEERLYTFTYSEGYLSSVKEIIMRSGEESNFTFSYEKGNLSSLVSNHYFQMIYRYNTSTVKNIDRLPWWPLTEMYPLYFHKIAFYAGILGRSLTCFPETIQVDGNEDETTYYHYEVGPDGRLVSLEEEIVSWGSTYTRTFTYSFY